MVTTAVLSAGQGAPSRRRGPRGRERCPDAARVGGPLRVASAEAASGHATIALVSSGVAVLEVPDRPSWACRTPVRGRAGQARIRGSECISDHPRPGDHHQGVHAHHRTSSASTWLDHKLRINPHPGSPQSGIGPGVGPQSASPIGLVQKGDLVQDQRCVGALMASSSES
jgi:hypothetical protein